MPIFNCKLCNKQFTKKINNGKTPVFCSQICNNLNNRTRIKKNCTKCHNEYEVNLYKKDSTKYCSRLCQNRSLTEKRIIRIEELKKNQTYEQKIEILKSRFEKYIIKKIGCWDWVKGKDRDGYGLISFERKYLRLHRAAWMIYKGPIPEGYLVCHNCPGGDNPSCANIQHLFLGLPKDNTKDMFIKGRGPKQFGEHNPQSKLTDQDVIKIKKLLINQSALQISKLFNVCYETILNIKKNKSWKHVKLEE